MGKTKGLSLGGQCVSPPSGQELREHPPMETPHTHTFLIPAFIGAKCSPPEEAATQPIRSRALQGHVVPGHLHPSTQHWDSQCPAWVH